jgi:hypothetical protein
MVSVDINAMFTFKQRKEPFPGGLKELVERIEVSFPEITVDNDLIGVIDDIGKKPILLFTEIYS